MSPGVQTPDNHAEKEHDECQRNREAEFAREDGERVTSPNCVELVKDERERRHGKERRMGKRQPPEACERPRAQGQGDQPAYGDQLERHRIGQDDVEQDDEERRKRKVEVVRREAGIPVGGPPAQPAVGENMVPHVGGSPDVCPHVPPRRRRVQHQERRVKRDDDKSHRAPDDEKRNAVLPEFSAPHGPAFSRDVVVTPRDAWE